MPETTVNKDDSFIFWQNNIRLAGQVFYVEAVTKAIGVQKFPYQHFWLCILPFNLTHIKAPGSFAMYICHFTNLVQAKLTSTYCALA